MLKIKNLHVSIHDKSILNGLNLEIRPGEIHAIMGPNGAGKSTLASVLAGKENAVVTKGTIHYQGKNVLALAPEERAAFGIFLAFQYPCELPGVSSMIFLKTALNSIRKYRKEPLLDTAQFLEFIREKKKLIHIGEHLLSRSVNEEFSGGEKKKFEIFQMAVLNPTLAILDEIDSGLDIDALKNVAEGVSQLRTKNNAFLLITHYQRLLHYIVPDFVHVMFQGKIVKSGGKELAEELEKQGYEKLKF